MKELGQISHISEFKIAVDVSTDKPNWADSKLSSVYEIQRVGDLASPIGPAETYFDDFYQTKSANSTIFTSIDAARCLLFHSSQSFERKPKLKGFSDKFLCH